MCHSEPAGFFRLANPTLFVLSPGTCCGVTFLQTWPCGLLLGNGSNLLFFQWLSLLLLAQAPPTDKTPRVQVTPTPAAPRGPNDSSRGVPAPLGDLASS